MKLFVVVVHRTTTSRTGDTDMLAIQCPQDIVEVPTESKLLSYSVPLGRCSEIGDHLMAELLNDGFADLENEVADGVVRNPEAIHEGLVGITSCQVPQGDGQLQSYWQGFMLVGVPSSDELLELDWFHSDEILEGLDIYHFLHQPLILTWKTSPKKPRPDPITSRPPCKSMRDAFCAAAAMAASSPTICLSRSARSHRNRRISTSAQEHGEVKW